MLNRHKFSFIFSCILIDFLAFIVTACIFIKYAKTLDLAENSIKSDYIIIASVMTWSLSALYFRLYHISTTFNLEVFYRQTWRTCLLKAILWQIFIFILQGGELYINNTHANLYQFTFWILYVFFSRCLITLLLFSVKKNSNKLINVAIWGFNKTSIELAAVFESNVSFLNFKGIINEEMEVEFNTSEEFKIELNKAIKQAHEEKIDELYIVTAPNNITDLNQYFNLADYYCIRLKFVPDFSTISSESFATSNFNNFHVIKPRHEPLQNAYNRLLKRIFDLAFSCFVIIFILSWLYPLIGGIIKYQSKGPILFKQLRTGQKNKPFWCYKFRSMKVNESSDSLQAQKGDSRITPIGQFIRRTSLDELPQFFNVLLGDMSIVGPRPHMLKHTEDYNDLISNFMVRHFVKPGITGLAQVSGLRGETKKVSDMKRRVNADIQYVQNWNLIKDIKICFLTLIVTIKGDENAY
ncbi:exopolysaccharide biosynthesis polyprenyl glycosylphosphotransferase [Flavobacterium sp.]|uniref:exopolysaccharide biosynthesis polyprenyl glycosylphosphotransferase n=1 Tax=Flavobacterium sp. TaxID=239 RepID=UPI003BD57DEE